jgi:replicative superfamily II helicase
MNDFFDKLRTNKPKPKPTDPLEIFRRQPKPPGFNDLYTSQADILQEWYARRDSKDTVLKLHTGGGKTIVGLLIAQSSMNELGGPVLYLAPTVQLVHQTLEKAKAHGIPAVPYVKGQGLHDDFNNGTAVLVAAYQALFNGRSLFGLRGKPHVPLAAVILDDAHTAFTSLRDQFTLDVHREQDSDTYESLASLFRRSFEEADRIGTYDDVVSGRDYGIMEVPYWDWLDKRHTVLEVLKPISENYTFEWPLLRDKLHLCHALISRSAFSITSVLPVIDMFPSFVDCGRRVYMSATIADDSEIVRTFGANPEDVKNALTSRSLAGISERMILVPDLMPWDFKTDNAKELLISAAKQELGAVVLTASENAASKWKDVAEVPKASPAVDAVVNRLQKGNRDKPAVFANRYDGIDLPGDACRLLVLSGMPTGSSSYELFRSTALFGGSTIARMLAQRIEQGIGRGARGSGDHCVVLLHGADVAGWIAKKVNFQFLTSATRAQIEIGSKVSMEVADADSLCEIISWSYNRDSKWMEYHSETLADLVTQDPLDHERIKIAKFERKAFDLWHDGYYEKALNKLEKIRSLLADDPQTLGWIEQFAARIAYAWGQRDLSSDLQAHAYSHNRGLLRPLSKPPYEPLTIVGSQAERVASCVAEFVPRRGALKQFDESLINLNPEASANQFEQSLVHLAEFAGFVAERHDDQGLGPDVLWLLPNKVGLVIEAKSRKEEKNVLTKDQHGQLLVAENWFQQSYPDYRSIRVSVHPNDLATAASSTHGSYVFTFESLAEFKAEVRGVLETVAESKVDDVDLPAVASRALEKSRINVSDIEKKFLKPFRVSG